MSQKDITEKMLFTYNDVFADVVNALLFKREQVIAEEELVDQAPRAAYKADGVIRDIERDVAKRWLKNNIRIACIGIENQTEPDQDMAIRVFSYDSAEYRAQLSTETLKHVEAVLQLLSVMTQDTRFEDVLKWEKGPEGGVHNMCEVLDRVEAIGMEKGEIKGAIRIYREEMNLSPAEIVRKLVTKFTLDEKEAWEYVNTAMDVQQ